MKTTILSARDIGFLVEKVGLDSLMDQLIGRIDEALRNYNPEQRITPARQGFNYHDEHHTGLIEWMPAMLAGDRVTVKMVGYHPGNPLRWRLPTILSTVSVFDVATGHLRGLADATFLTALRTGAASAIASRALARESSRTLGLIGAGAQACTQLHALSRLFRFERVLVYDTDTAASRSFAARVARLGLTDNIRLADCQTVVSESDILCTATSVDIGNGPVFHDRDVPPWLHINAVGADFPGKVEVPLSVLQRSLVVPDFLAQAVQEGECQQLRPEQIGAELAEVVRETERFTGYRERLTVFDSTGWALEDQVAMDLLMDFAHELKLGSAVALESIAPDPKDPYGFLLGGPCAVRSEDVAA